MKWNFQGWPRKNKVEFQEVLKLKKLKKIHGISRVGAVFSGLSRGSKVKKMKNSRGGFKKVDYVLPPPIWIFSGIAQFRNWPSQFLHS